MRILIAILAMLVSSCSFKSAAPVQKPGMTVCVRKACVDVELAATPETRALGLMHRDGLEPGRGMFFVFEADGRYAFWMKNMKFPIDILWITPDMRVGTVYENVQPCGDGDCPSIDPGIDARYVLEVEAGFAKRNAISAGDRVTLR